MFDNLFAKAAAPRPAPEQQQQPEASSSQPQGSAALPASPPAVAARPASARCQARPHAAHWGFEFCGDDAFEFLVPASPQLRSH